MFRRNISIVAIVAAIIMLAFSAVLADEEESGWAVCVLYGSSYNQHECIIKIRDTFADPDNPPPSTGPTSEESALAVYEWAIELVSECTAVGAGGAMLPQEIIDTCPDIVPWTPTSTRTPTSTPTDEPEATATLTPTLTPDATPAPVETPIIVDPHPPFLMYIWAPIVGVCDYLFNYDSCGW